MAASAKRDLSLASSLEDSIAEPEPINSGSPSTPIVDPTYTPVTTETETVSSTVRQSKESVPSSTQPPKSLKTRIQKGSPTKSSEDGKMLKMEPVGLLECPDELLILVSRYLPVKDILALSLVCHRLRDILSDNQVWRGRFPAQSAPHLEARKQLVSPRLPSLGASFGQQRAHYARRTHLLNNWRSGKHKTFHKHRNSLTPQQKIERVNVRKEFKFVAVSKFSRSRLYKDIYFFFDRPNGGIEVWDVARIPKLHTTVPINYVDYNCFFVSGTKLVFIKYIKVVVYDIVLPEKEFPLLYSFTITGTSVTPERNIIHPGCHKKCCVNDGWWHFEIDRYLVSLEPKACIVLQVWDIAEGTKVGSFPCPVSGAFSFRSFTSSCMADDKLWFGVLTKNTTTDHVDFVVLMFDMKKGDFPYSVVCDEGNVAKLLVHDDHIILFYEVSEQDNESLCIVKNQITGAEVARKSFTGFIDNSWTDDEISQWTDLFRPAMFNGKLTKICDDGFHIFDALSLECTACIPCEGLVCIIKQVKVLDYVFTLAEKDDGVYELWDLDNKRKVSAISTTTILKGHFSIVMQLNESSTALVYFECNSFYGKEKIGVIHFW